MNKTDLRYKMQIKRRYLGPIVRLEADRAILENFLNAFEKYDSFFIYNSFGDEARTDLICGELLKEGKAVFLPVVKGKEIFPAAYTSDTPLKDGAFGIKEPVSGIYTGDIDVTIAPLLAVNGRGHRVGYGKGFYDRYLRDKKTLKVGLGYFFQMEEFPEDPSDVPLNKYLCERGIYDFDEKDR